MSGEVTGATGLTNSHIMPTSIWLCTPEGIPGGTPPGCDAKLGKRHQLAGVYGDVTL